ncbi:hypothetical protein FC770_10480 [Nocardioides jishulii]|uniref:Uncharacterized protein n=1 Tax=Nocardioides jishulii TaxID=2575440 RepID=A0A4U2YL10_9ACTN|nr:hypothetical protein FCL41_03845 [Nocardioides jishulii]TKI61255.1 hypothetical protein FC770_10480 [Nocardioides jishulii]
MDTSQAAPSGRGAPGSNPCAAAALLRQGRVQLVDDAAVLRDQRHRIEEAYFGRRPDPGA